MDTHENTPCKLDQTWQWQLKKRRHQSLLTSADIIF